MNIIVVSPRGFCAGVERAIEIVERVLELFGAPIYVKHQLVHNNYVVKRLENKGAIFIDELHQVPDHSTVIFSAHGVSKQVRAEAAARRLRVYDATCPLVMKVHMEVARYLQDGRECILIGHRGHPEVEGILGYQSKDDQYAIYLLENEQDARDVKVDNPESVALVTQTTLSLDDTAAIVDILRRRFPDITTPGKKDICYATQNRQQAVKRLNEHCDILLVIGSNNSSNATRLMEVGEKTGLPSYLIDNAREIDRRWLEGKQNIGITAGASTPELLVQSVIQQLVEWGGDLVSELPGDTEKVIFPLPRDLIK